MREMSAEDRFFEVNARIISYLHAKADEYERMGREETAKNLRGISGWIAVNADALLDVAREKRDVGVLIIFYTDYYFSILALRDVLRDLYGEIADKIYFKALNSAIELMAETIENWRSKEAPITTTG